MASAEAGGIVDEHVDAAEGRAGLGDVTLHRRRIRQVAGRSMYFDPELRDLAADTVQWFGAAGADRDRRSRGGAGERDGPTDAAAAAGHHRPFPAQIDVHRFAPLPDRTNLDVARLRDRAPGLERCGCV